MDHCYAVSRLSSVTPELALVHKRIKIMGYILVQ